MIDNLWQRISAVGPGKSHVIPATWPYDRYPNMPELTAGNKVVLLDQDGPGVVSCLHVSAYTRKDRFALTSDAAQSLVLRVWYDGEPVPAIEMSLMDFLGDIQCASDYFSTVYFSKVRESHNLRLPMPFRKHVRIEVENASAVDLFGYMDLQWEQVPAVPEDCGTLRAELRTGTLSIPDEPATLWDISAPGAVVAHWLQIEADDPLCHNGELLCEANDEIYLDGDSLPTLEYLGTEDFYGFSWGFHGTQCDGHVAILKRDDLPNGGARIAILRTRELDRITFQRSCKLVMNYACERLDRAVQARAKGGVAATYRSCVYYYRREPGGPRWISASA